MKRFTVSLGLDGFTVRSRNRFYLVVFAIGTDKRPGNWPGFIQFGDHCFWPVRSLRWRLASIFGPRE